MIGGQRAGAAAMDQITLDCECGKLMRAPAAIANRQVDCPRCGKGLRVPVPVVDTACEIETIAAVGAAAMVAQAVGMATASARL